MDRGATNTEQGKAMGTNHTTEQLNQAVRNEVTNGRSPSTEGEIERAFPKTDVLRYITNDSFIADPTKLLGRVYYEKAGSNALTPFITRVAVAVDEESKLTTPSTVSELILDSKLNASTDILSLVSLSVGMDEVFEVRVINNAAARAVDVGDAWDAALDKWLNTPRCRSLIEDPDVTSVSVVTGVVQKYLTTKKYRKFEAGVKGGYAGVSVGGSLYTSSSEFQLHVVYGVDLVSFGAPGRPDAAREVRAALQPMARIDVETTADKFASMAVKRGFALPRSRGRK